MRSLTPYSLVSTILRWTSVSSLLFCDTSRNLFHYGHHISYSAYSYYLLFLENWNLWFWIYYLSIAPTDPITHHLSLHNHHLSKIPSPSLLHIISLISRQASHMLPISPVHAYVCSFPIYNDLTYRTRWFRLKLFLTVDQRSTSCQIAVHNIFITPPNTSLLLQTASRGPCRTRLRCVIVIEHLVIARAHARPITDTTI